MSYCKDSSINWDYLHAFSNISCYLTLHFYKLGLNNSLLSICWVKSFYFIIWWDKLISVGLHYLGLYYFTTFVLLELIL